MDREETRDSKPNPRDVHSFLSSTVATKDKLEVTLTVIHTNERRHIRGSLRLFITTPDDGNASALERIRYELISNDRRDGSENQTVCAWRADKPDVYHFSGDGFIRGKDGNVSSARSEATQDIPLSRPIDPLAVLAILNVGKEVGDKAVLDFLREYLPPELGLQFKY